jgi:glycosyltransferase involved in cell wall biosynthesis
MTSAKILHLRASNFVGGPENQLLRHAGTNDGSLWEVWIGVYVKGQEGLELFDTARSRGIPAVSLPVESITSSVLTLRRTLQESQIKLLCTHGYKAEVIGLLAGRMTGIPVACFLRGWTGENLKVKLYEAIERSSLGLADRIVCLSNLQARKISERPSLTRKIRVVHNAIDVQATDTESRDRSRKLLVDRLSIPPQATVIATAGRLSPEKGVADFLDAASLLSTQASHNSAFFVVFGEGSLEKTLREKANILKLDDRIVFAGFQRDLRELLPAIDILVNASQSEEMPNVVLEAMAAGVPVVATEVGGLAEIAGDDPAVKLVPVGRPEVLAEEIGSLLSAPDVRFAFGQKGFQRVKQAFSVESQAKEFDSLYREILCAEASRDER